MTLTKKNDSHSTVLMEFMEVEVREAPMLGVQHLLVEVVDALVHLLDELVRGILDQAKGSNRLVIGLGHP